MLASVVNARPPGRVGLRVLCVSLTASVCLCCRFRGQGSLVLRRKDGGIRVQGEGICLLSLPAVAHRPCQVKAYGGTRLGAWCCTGQGSGGTWRRWGALRKRGSHEGGQFSGESWAPDGLQPLEGSPQAPSCLGVTAAPTTASLAALRERGGGSKIREKQFDVSNKASLHFAKLILTPIIICCRSGRVLPTAA